MSGYTDVDPDDPKPVDQIAYKDADGNWRAGPEAPGDYESGQFVPVHKDPDRDGPGGDVGRSRTVRRRNNSVRGIIQMSRKKRNQDRAERFDSELTEREARDILNDWVQAKADDDLSGDEIRDIRSALFGY